MKSYHGTVENDPCARAVAAADALFQNPSADPGYEPDSPASARAAVQHLGRRFAQMPGVFTEALEGARAGAQALSGDRLQGIAEIRLS